MKVTMPVSLLVRSMTSVTSLLLVTSVFVALTQGDDPTARNPQESRFNEKNVTTASQHSETKNPKGSSTFYTVPQTEQRANKTAVLPQEPETKGGQGSEARRSRRHGDLSSDDLLLFSRQSKRLKINGERRRLNTLHGPNIGLKTSGHSKHSLGKRSFDSISNSDLSGIYQNHLGKRSFDSFGRSDLSEIFKNHLGNPNYLTRRSFDSIGESGLSGINQNYLGKRSFDSIGESGLSGMNQNYLGKRSFDSIGESGLSGINQNFLGKKNFDSISESGLTGINQNYLGKRNFDSIAGSDLSGLHQNYLGKRSFISLSDRDLSGLFKNHLGSQNYLDRRSFDSIGESGLTGINQNYLGKRTFDSIGESGLSGIDQNYLGKKNYIYSRSSDSIGTSGLSGINQNHLGKRSFDSIGESGLSGINQNYLGGKRFDSVWGRGLADFDQNFLDKRNVHFIRKRQFDPIAESQLSGISQNYLNDKRVSTARGPYTNFHFNDDYDTLKREKESDDFPADKGLTDPDDVWQNLAPFLRQQKDLNKYLHPIEKRNAQSTSRIRFIAKRSSGAETHSTVKEKRARRVKRRVDSSTQHRNEQEAVQLRTQTQLTELQQRGHLISKRNSDFSKTITGSQTSSQRTLNSRPESQGNSLVPGAGQTVHFKYWNAPILAQDLRDEQDSASQSQDGLELSGLEAIVGAKSSATANDVDGLSMTQESGRDYRENGDLENIEGDNAGEEGMRQRDLEEGNVTRETGDKSGTGVAEASHLGTEDFQYH